MGKRKAEKAPTDSATSEGYKRKSSKRSKRDHPHSNQKQVTNASGANNVPVANPRTAHKADDLEPSSTTPSSSPTVPPPPLPKTGPVKASSPNSPQPVPLLAPATTTPDLDFGSYYLQRLTAEFADDIDRLRKAPDFKGEASVEVLVAALREGEKLFTPEEKELVMSCVRGRGMPKEIKQFEEGDTSD